MVGICQPLLLTIIALRGKERAILMSRWCPDEYCSEDVLGVGVRSCIRSEAEEALFEESALSGICSSYGRSTNTVPPHPHLTESSYDTNDAMIED